VTASTPSCTVIVPTHGRPLQLADCLEALADLDYPPDRLEVIVVDDGGSEPLGTVIDPVRERVEVTLIRQRRQGPAAARNTGAAYAQGELLAFVDDDCRPAPDWLRRLADAHVAAPDVALGGHTRNELVGNPYATVSQLIVDAGYARHNGDRADARFFTTNNFAVPAVGFRDLGGFDARFVTSEDRDFCDRWVAQGRRMHYLPEAVVFHAHRLTLRGFCRQHVAYGRGAFRFHLEHKVRSGRRIRLEPSFYLGLHRRALRGRGFGEALVLQAVIVLWHVTNTAGFLWEWWFPRRGYEGSGPTSDGPHAPEREPA
jgi:GT2 family glycosyltransferase